jgi:membrane protein implicated in regulation of membrane protease activity
MNDLLTNPAIIWFIAGFLLCAGELLTSGFIILFFGLGAFVTALICFFFDINLDIQLSLFLFSSLLLLFLLRKKLSFVFTGDSSDSSTSDFKDDLIGKKAVVLNDIKPGYTGKVSFRGSEWSAESDYYLKTGEPVIITGKQSIKLIIEPFKKKEE